MDEVMKNWIDNASYEELLRKWRFAPVGSPWFTGDIGNYYSEVMSKGKLLISNADAVKASKKLGWEEEGEENS